MTTITHGTVLPLDSTISSDTVQPTFPFDYMFPQLQSREFLLEESPITVESLRRLGAIGMKDPTVDKLPGVMVPAIYTFFGQFIDHDITREKGSASIRLANPSPIDPKLIPKQIVNSRSPNLDLKNVYVPNGYGEFAPRDPADKNKLLIEKVGLGNLGL